MRDIARGGLAKRGAPVKTGRLMAETEKGKVRWKAFVCPMCRLIFRVRSDYEFGGVVCTSCHHVLRIPADGDAIPPLLDAQLNAKARATLARVGKKAGRATSRQVQNLRDSENQLDKDLRLDE